MGRDIPKEVENLKTLLLQATPIWIDGIDFLAFNYGDESQPHSMAGYPTGITSASGSAVIDRRTGRWRFVAPHMRLTNVSHVSRFDRARVNLTFDEVRTKIEKS